MNCELSMPAATQDGSGQRTCREQTIAAAITLDLQTKDSVRGK
jgi:hypothetical protein